jgi:hypothetical protein
VGENWVEVLRSLRVIFILLFPGYAPFSKSIRASIETVPVVLPEYDILLDNQPPCVPLIFFEATHSEFTFIPFVDGKEIQFGSLVLTLSTGEVTLVCSEHPITNKLSKTIIDIYFFILLFLFYFI